MGQLTETLQIVSGILFKIGIAGTAFMVIYLLFYMLEFADIKKISIGFCSVFIAIWFLIIVSGVIMII